MEGQLAEGVEGLSLDDAAQQAQQAAQQQQEAAAAAAALVGDGSEFFDQQGAGACLGLLRTLRPCALRACLRALGLLRGGPAGRQASARPREPCKAGISLSALCSTSPPPPCRGLL